MEELNELMGKILGSAFQQGMAAQRIENGQRDFNEQAEAIHDHMEKFRSMMNANDNPQRTQ